MVTKLDHYLWAFIDVRTYFWSLKWTKIAWLCPFKVFKIIGSTDQVPQNLFSAKNVSIWKSSNKSQNKPLQTIHSIYTVVYLFQRIKSTSKGVTFYKRLHCLAIEFRLCFHTTKTKYIAQIARRIFLYPPQKTTSLKPMPVLHYVGEVSKTTSCVS